MMKKGHLQSEKGESNLDVGLLLEDADKKQSLSVFPMVEQSS